LCAAGEQVDAKCKAGDEVDRAESKEVSENGRVEIAKDFKRGIVACKIGEEAFMKEPCLYETR